MSNSKLFATFMWPLLGFKRGIDSYNYHYLKNDSYKYSTNHKPPPLFIHKIGWGIGAASAYINPFTILFVLYKEMYRFEINIRGLEEEKKTDFYNEVL